MAFIEYPGNKTKKENTEPKTFSFTTKKGGSMICGNLMDAIKKAEKNGKPVIKCGSQEVAWPF